MYCPQCKAEYRQGFTRCADCDVDLVHEPPPAAHGFGTAGETGSHGEDSDDPFCSFWRGDDPRIHAELCELLNEEGIPHKTVRREDHLFNLNSKSGFQIGIPYSQFEKAEAAIKRCLWNGGRTGGCRTTPALSKRLRASSSRHTCLAAVAEGICANGRRRERETENDGAAGLEEPLWTMTPRNGSRTGTHELNSEEGHAASVVE